MNEPAPPIKGWRLWEWAVVIVVVCLLLIVGIGLGTLRVLRDITQETTSASNARQILLALKTWAQEHNGQYPSGPTSNAVFRELIRAGLLRDERVFGCLPSPFVPDGEMGDAPDFSKAVGPGENHWMMFRMAKASEDRDFPLIVDNALNATWPLQWSIQTDGKPARGCPKRDGKILIGLEDLSVVMEHGKPSGPNTLTLPANALQPPRTSPLPPMEVLDIEERK